MPTNHGIKPEYMDRKANPGVDFFRYANGTYVDTAKLPAGYPRWGSFLELRELSLNRLHEMMEQATANTTATAGSNEQKMGDFYAVGMDEAKVETAGIKPLSADFARINQVRTRRQLASAIAHLHQLGVGSFFGFGSMQSFADSSQMIAAVGQGGLGMPDRDYYLKTDAASAERREKYVAHIGNMLKLLGERTKVAQRHARAIIAIETALATAAMPKEDQRDPNNINHPMTVADFQALVPTFAFETYFHGVNAPAFSSLNVLQPDFFKALNELLAKTSWSDIRAYLRWSLIAMTSPYLSSAFVNERFEFMGKVMSGVSEQQPRWKRVVGTVNGAIGEAIGELYVARYFPAEAKARVLAMIENGKSVMRLAINDATWLSDATKQKLLAKLDKTNWKIGYPDKWTDYSPLSIDRGSYVGNVLRANRFGFELDVQKIGKARDKSEWGMTPQTVNAYAAPQSNEVVFPAAILQPPFFDYEADDAANYGGILVVILHEFGHLFDDSGAQYDADGVVNMQWTKQDFENFMTRIQLIRNQFSRFSVGPNKVHLKGDLVSGEAAADLNGVNLSYRALQIALAKTGRTVDANGFNDEQRFFIAFGQIWASICTPQYAEQQAMTDPHPGEQFRVNGTLANVAEFPKAFGLPDDCPIMLPPAERCHVW